MEFTFNYANKPSATFEVMDLIVDGIDTRDYPDFADAYIDSALVEDGNVLRKATDEELDLLSDNGDIVYAAVEKHLY